MSFGTSADPAVVDPTAQASFMSLAKGILKTIIDSGTAAIDNVLGAIDDAAVTTDTSATITARLRGLVNLISALNAKVMACDTSALATQATLAAQSAKLPASLGVKAGSASLSVAQCTEDAAVMAKLGARIAQPNMLVAPTIVAIDTSSAAATGLTVGTAYMVYVTAPCWVEVGPDAVAAETTNTYIEPGMIFVWTPTADDTDDGIACIASVAGGSMYVQACQA